MVHNAFVIIVNDCARLASILVVVVVVLVLAVVVVEAIASQQQVRAISIAIKYLQFKQTIN